MDITIGIAKKIGQSQGANLHNYDGLFCRGRAPARPDFAVYAACNGTRRGASPTGFVHFDNKCVFMRLP